MALPMWMVAIYEANAERDQIESCNVSRMQDDYSGGEEVQHYDTAYVYDRVMVRAATMADALLRAMQMVGRPQSCRRCDERRDALRNLLCEGHDADDYVHTPDNSGCVICDLGLRAAARHAAAGAEAEQDARKV